MIRKQCSYLFAGILLLGLFSIPAFGDDSEQPSSPPEAGVSAGQPADGTGRNPFSETDPIQKQGLRRRSATAPSPAAAKLPEGFPKLILKGYIEGSDGTTAALLEVQGAGLYVVREGGTFSLHAGQQNIPVRVREIRHLGAVILVGTQDVVVVVR